MQNKIFKCNFVVTNFDLENNTIIKNRVKKYKYLSSKSNNRKIEAANIVEEFLEKAKICRSSLDYSNVELKDNCELEDLLTIKENGKISKFRFYLLDIFRTSICP